MVDCQTSSTDQWDPASFSHQHSTNHIYRTVSCMYKQAEKSADAEKPRDVPYCSKTFSRISHNKKISYR